MATADIYRALWRHKYFIGVLTAILVAAAWYFTSRQTPIYQASTLVGIQQRAEKDPGDIESAVALSERLALTYSKVAETATIWERTYERLGPRVPRSERDVRLSAEPVEDTELIRISARSADPRQATLVANAVPATLAAFIREKTGLRNQVRRYEAARTPVTPSSPNMKINLAIAFLLGIIFNGALALLIAVLSDRLPDTDELEASLGRPVLATIPMLNFTTSRSKREDTGEAEEILEGIAPGDNGAPREPSRERRSRIG